MPWGNPGFFVGKAIVIRVGRDWKFHEKTVTSCQVGLKTIVCRLVQVDVQEYQSKESTGSQMRFVVENDWSDLGGYINWPYPAWFDFVRLIPYESDAERFPDRVIELVPRPAYLLDRQLFPSLDCKKKSILLAAWAYGHGLPYRFLAVSQKPNGEVHHVFPQIDFGEGWSNEDATFASFMSGMGQPLTFAAELIK